MESNIRNIIGLVMVLFTDIFMIWFGAYTVYKQVIMQWSDFWIFLFVCPWLIVVLCAGYIYALCVINENVPDTIDSLINSYKKGLTRTKH